MNEIKRYDTFGEGEFMYPFEDGGYVRFDEHQSAIDRLRAERDDALAAAESKAGWEWKKRAEKAEAERDAAVADAASLRERMLVLEAQRDKFHSDAFQSENARRKDEKDARRYRWVRDPNNYPNTDDFDSYWSDILGECCDEQSFDYAIDSAMKEQEQGK